MARRQEGILRQIRDEAKHQLRGFPRELKHQLRGFGGEVRETDLRDVEPAPTQQMTFQFRAR